ncbi:TRAP transporter small permease [Martelella limonii]|uniref:TRAP transporter small permease n=1 Tax=Martelella limonii TaxID=1647649 RepID=UPI0018849471|nr:TRAP transporter small permease [Martelella limonii]
MSANQKPDIFSRLVNAIARVIDALLGVAIVIGFSVMVGCVVWQVVSRYVLQTPSIYTDEISRFLFIWVALIGGAYTFGKGRHLAIELLAPALSGWQKKASELLVLAIIALFAIMVMMKGGGGLVARTLANGQVSPAMQLPMGYIYLALPIGGAIILFYCLQMALKVVTRDDAVEIGQSETAGGGLD